MKRRVKSAYRKNYEFYPVTQEQYFFITVDKKDYILNKDINTFSEDGNTYTLVNNEKILLIF